MNKSVLEIASSRRTLGEAFLLWTVSPFPASGVLKLSIGLPAYPFSAPIHFFNGVLSFFVGLFQQPLTGAGRGNIEFVISNIGFGVACFITAYLVVVALRLLNEKYGLLDFVDR